MSARELQESEAPFESPAPGAPSSAYAALGSLTLEQAQAVSHGSGPLLLFAGPGAGKTATIISRIAHLLASGRAQTTQILALTFTVRAAGEMRLRLRDLLGAEVVAGLTVCTFHALCAGVLREHAECFQRSSEHTIYDSSDLLRLIKQVLCDESRDRVLAELASCGKASPELIRQEISQAKNRLWCPELYRARAPSPLAPLIACVWEELEEELRLCNAFDLDDLLANTVRLLADHSRLKEHYRARWPWALVDELQDTNHVQMVLLGLLSGPHGNLVAVGDDDQCLYSWRGAQPGNILRFGDTFPGHRRLLLARNFRSREEILTAATRAVASNQQREPKALSSQRGSGGQVVLVGFQSEVQEAVWVCDQVESALQAGIEPEEIMVLARTQAMMGTLQRELAASGLPYRVLGDRGLFERSEVRDAIGYLSLLVNPRDGAAFRRIAQYLPGVGRASVERLISVSREADGDIINMALQSQQLETIRSSAARASLAGFGSEMQHIRAEVLPQRSLSATVVGTLTMTCGIVRAFERKREDGRGRKERYDAERVLEDLRSLARAAGSFSRAEAGQAGLQGFLEEACGVQRQSLPEGRDRRFTLSTIHRAKGTEAQVVFLLGCEEGRLPHRRALESAQHGALEEECRAFYVGCTRSKDILLLSVCEQRDGRPTEGASRFLRQAGLLAPADAPAHQ